MAYERVKVAEQQTATTMTLAIKDYKKMENFAWEVLEPGTDVYVVRFIDYKNKVAQVYPQLNLSKISAIEATPEGGKEEEGVIVVEDVVMAKELAITKELGTEETAAMTKVLEEPLVNPETST